MKLLFAFIASLIALGSGCSVSEFSNPQRKSAAECKKLNGMQIGKYCLWGSDAGEQDAGDQLPDSGMPGESCMVDEVCYTGDPSTRAQAPCKPGLRKCQDGVLGSECVGEVTPQDKEICNGKDDDCNGKVDELSRESCDVMSAKGACANGQSLCQEGMPLCAQVVFPSMDVCNDEDDDCDGKVDENTDVSCYPDGDPGCTHRASGGFDCVGTCAPGVFACNGGSYSGDCKGFVHPVEEHCTLNGETERDEDCDGQTDEGCACKDGTACYSGPPGTQDVGPCHGGTRKCVDATHRPCEGEVTPKAEDCSNLGVDDDCNGTMDDVPMLDTACDTNAMGACKTKARWKCDDGQLTCVPGQSSDEVCDGNGVDEDCDGKVDEGFDTKTNEDNCGGCGRKCGPELTCCDGVCVSTLVSKNNCMTCGHVCSGACCNGVCKNTSNDKNNCGSCGTVCPTLLGLLGSCSGGTCQ